MAHPVWFVHLQYMLILNKNVMQKNWGGGIKSQSSSHNIYLLDIIFS